MSDAYFVREPTPNDGTPMPEGMTVNVEGEAEQPRTNKNGTVEVELADGGLAIYPNGLPQKPKSNDFGGNLAEDLDAGELARISEELLTGIESDEQSRATWLETRAKGIGLLALQVEQPKSAASDGGGPMQGVSVVRSPLLLEANLRFQANASAELLPSGGPVKVKNDTPPQTREEDAKQQAMQMAGIKPEQSEDDVLGECLEREMNHYLTVTDKEYYPDFRRMLFYTGFGGSGFRKVYKCPLKRRPVSRGIDAADLIVADPEVSLYDCGRVTHKIMMRQSVLKRMQLAEQYRDVVLAPPIEGEENAVEAKENSVAGIQPVRQLPSDHKHTIYECYCELDIKGYEHKEDNKETGLPLPYRVTIDKDSREILEIRRNWKEDDDRFLARMPIVKFPFVEGLSFYGIGLLQILGNSTAAVTAAWRLALDAGMMASFPAFLYSDVASRQNTNVFRLAPGAGVKINTGGLPISEVVMPAPYHDATPGLINMMTHVEETAGRVGGVAELPVGEGKQDAPVGTTIALLDQATKVMAAVHKGLHSAQAEEFSLLVELFKEDPEALLIGNKRPSRNWQGDELLKALDNNNLVPQADPNTPSHMVRVMRAVALLQLYQMNPQAWDYKELVKRITRMVGEDEIDGLFAPPAPPNQQPDPLLIMAQAKMQDSQTKAQQVQISAATAQQKVQNDAAKVASDRDVANANIVRDLIIHQGGQQSKSNALVSDHMANAAQMAQGQSQHHDNQMQQHLERLLRMHEMQNRPQGRIL